MLSGWRGYNVSDLDQNYLTEMFPNGKFIYVSRDPRYRVLREIRTCNRPPDHYLYKNDFILKFQIF